MLERTLVNNVFPNESWMFYSTHTRFYDGLYDGFYDEQIFKKSILNQF